MNQIDLIFPYDYILLIITLLFVLFSIWKGLIQSILGLLTWVGSILITLYSYNSFAEFITSKILNINFFQNYEILSNILGFIISIPIIFLISLFVLKKIRKFLSSDLDKQILGIIFDKFFGFIYGLVFSYFIFSTILFTNNRFEFVELNNWMINNSNILNKIQELNTYYTYNFYLIESNIE